ncbi:MAG TPA: CocE/NonD family hydrolase, partial [Acidimicrobiales bacterium]
MPTAARTGTHSLVALLVGWLVATTLLPTAVAAASTPGFSAVGSARQVYATGLPAAASASLLGSTGHDLTTLRADALGGVLFRNVPAGGGYRVRLDSNGQESGPLVVHTDAAAPWDPGVYGQSLQQSGYGYLTTRDGTKLAIDVRLPLGSHAAPYPTVIEYSGYGYADPAGPQSGIATLAQLMGFAVVDVNMRGTGCSGGAFDYFEPLQNLDGYDVIETVAHQPWVLGHKVGMIGIS